MGPRTPHLILELLKSRSSLAPAYATRMRFSTTRQRSATRIYEPIRRPSELETLLLLNASSRTALLTLWTASWCRTCRTVAPIVKEVIEEYGANGAGNGDRGHDVGFVEIEYDAPENVELGSRYMVTSIPTLLAFSRQEAQMGTRIADAKKLADRAFLRDWIARESARGGDGGAGGVGWLGKVMETFRGQS